MYAYLVYLTRDRSLAEDLAADTFEKALRLWRRFDPAPGERPHLALPDRPHDCARLVPHRGAPEAARGACGGARACRRSVRRRACPPTWRPPLPALRRRARGDRAPHPAGARRRRGRARARHQPDGRLDAPVARPEEARGEGECHMSEPLLNEIRAAKPARAPGCASACGRWPRRSRHASPLSRPASHGGSSICSCSSRRRRRRGARRGDGDRADARRRRSRAAGGSPSPARPDARPRRATSQRRRTAPMRSGRWRRRPARPSRRHRRARDGPAAALRGRAEPARGRCRRALGRDEERTANRARTRR